jgi:four helix bundle protein
MPTLNSNKPHLKVRAKVFSVNLVKFVSGLPKQQIFWVISDQLLRSGTSIGANIIEAQAASSKRDFIKFYQIALKSANETMYWLEISRDATAADNQKIRKLLIEATELSKILGASLLTLKNRR